MPPDSQTRLSRVIGRPLREERQRLGLSQRALAEKSGLSQGQISQIENGRDLKVSTLLDLAAFLRLELTLIPRAIHPAVVQLMSPVSERSPIEALIVPDDDDDD